ncbi:hypothetical protein NW813_07335 [Synechococcus sp. R55.6]|jgi:hypothetical protein|uniref:hypothetical protein n=1 Tax=unclassified Synechococcus TaxID=2626047 RepID=UPI0039C20F0D
MKSSLVQLDYRVYKLARLLSEYLELGEWVALSAGSLGEEPSGNEHQAWLGRFSAYLSESEQGSCPGVGERDPVG